MIIDDTPINTRVKAPIASAINLGKSSEEDKRVSLFDYFSYLIRSIFVSR
jgi:hypothetical protein